MLSIVAWLFFLPGAALVSIPFVAIFNDVYTGDQALSALLGIVVALPGIVLVTVDVIRRGWRQARVGLWGILALVAPVVLGMLLAGFCDLTGICPRAGHVLVEEE